MQKRGFADHFNFGHFDNDHVGGDCQDAGDRAWVGHAGGQGRVGVNLRNDRQIVGGELLVDLFQARRVVPLEQCVRDRLDAGSP